MEIGNQLVARILTTGSHKTIAEPIKGVGTVAELIAFYKSVYAFEPVFRDGRKVAGMKSYKDVRGYLDRIERELGSVSLADLTFERVRAFRNSLLASPVTRNGKDRSLANVNRILSTFRRMCRVAFDNGWVTKDLFKGAEKLIQNSAEPIRQVELSTAQEKKLLAACEGKNAHMKAVVITLLDTGMRKGELLSIRWSDVDLKNKTINIRLTKNEKSRIVGLRERTVAALAELPSRFGDGLVFPSEQRVRTGWERIRVIAGLPQMHLHDLRHVAGERMVIAGVPFSEVALFLGHSDMKITLTRYANHLSVDRAQNAAKLLDKMAES